MRKSLSLLVLSFLLAGLVLAQDNQTTSITGDLRVISALLGIGPVDVYINDQLIGASLAPEQATPFLSVSPGQYNIAVYVAGADPLSVPVADTLLDLPPGASKTAIAYETRFAGSTSNTASATPSGNQLAGDVGFSQAGRFMILDDNRSPLQLGKTRLTAVHLAEGNPMKLSIAYPSRASLLHEISLEQPYGDIDIDAGVYPLTIVDAESPDLNRLAFVGDEVFQSNVHYTLIIVPDVRPTTVQNRPALPDLATRPTMFAIGAPMEPPDQGIQVRLIHAAHNTDVVDVYIDSHLVAPRFTYGEYTPYLGLADYSHVVELRQRDADPNSVPLATAEFTISEENQQQQYWTLLLLNASQDNLTSLDVVQADSRASAPDSTSSRAPVHMFNVAGNPVSLVLLPDNISLTKRGYSRVRVIHAIDGALEIGLIARGVPEDPTQPTPTPSRGTPTPVPPVSLVSPVIYGAEANENEIPSGVYQELDFVAGSSTDVLTLSDYQFLPGMVHTFVLIGQPSGEPAIQALELTDFGRGLPSQRLYLGTIHTDNDVLARVRQGPSTASSVVSQLESGSEVEVLGRNFNASWIKIRYTTATVNVPQEAWIAVQLVDVKRLGESINPLSLPEVQ